MAWTSCSRAARWRSPGPALRPASPAMPPAGRSKARRPATASREKERSEPLQALHPAADRDVALDGGVTDRGRDRLQAASRLRAPPGGLPDDPDRDVLPGRLAGRDGLRGLGPSGTAVRATARL